MRFYENRLELELDDWLDASLPRMYRFTPDAARPFCITQDFTDENEEFVATPLAPAFTPLMQTDGGIELVTHRGFRSAATLLSLKRS
jgi:hypothetical protein